MDFEGGLPVVVSRPNDFAGYLLIEIVDHN